MKIGELASQTGCDVQTVRFYEREGLLGAPERDSSGYRRYAPADLARLHFIRHCRSLDIPLPDVRRLLDFTLTPRQSCPEVNELLDGHIAHVRQRLTALKVLEKQLVALRRECKGGKATPCVILESFMSASAEHACACHPNARRSGSG